MLSLEENLKFDRLNNILDFCKHLQAKRIKEVEMVKNIIKNRQSNLNKLREKIKTEKLVYLNCLKKHIKESEYTEELRQKEEYYCEERCNYFKNNNSWIWIY